MKLKFKIYFIFHLSLCFACQDTGLFESKNYPEFKWSRKTLHSSEDNYDI